MQQVEQPKDDGLLAIFAAQLCDALRDADAVVVQNDAGTTLAAEPPSAAQADWLPPMPMAGRQKFTKLDMGRRRVSYAIELPLGDREGRSASGRLLVRMRGDKLPRHLKVLHGERDTIDCIQRQLTIWQELAQARLNTLQGAADLEFLTQCDALIGSADGDVVIADLLAHAARYMNSSLVLLLLPDQSISECWPADQLTGQYAKTTMMAAGKLLSNARDTQRAVVSQSDSLLQAMASSAGVGDHILCSPIADAHATVKGVLIVVRSAQFSRDEVRVARSLCVKLDSIAAGRRDAAPARIGRAALIERIDRDLQRDRRRQRALLFMNIDRLHVVNDRFGHAEGDAVIAAVTDIVAAVAGPRDVVASLSGDCIGLYLDQADDGKAQRVAAYILEKTARLPVGGRHDAISLTASFGIAVIPEHAATGSQAISVAEVATRSAKSRGTGQIVVFRDLDASIVQRHSDLSEIGNLQSALIDDRFVLYAQPIAGSKDVGAPRKYEVLTRMIDLDGTLVPPNRFLSAAERYNMMPSVDRWVVTQALRQLAEAENPLEINLTRFSINISGQSLTDPEFLPFLRRSVLASGLSPDALSFEITESSAVRSIESAVTFIQQMRELGCSVALDDFGTGYCSFSYLQDLPVDFIKIDGMFVRGLLDNTLSQAIVAGVIGVARVMGAATIAEYVEQDGVREHLASLGVDFVQGFGIGRPQPLSEVLESMDAPAALGLTDTYRITQTFDVAEGH